MAETPATYAEPLQRHSLQTRAHAWAIGLRLRQCGSLPAFWESCSRVDWLLLVLGEAADEGFVPEDVKPALRRFACWSAGEAGADPEDVLMVYATALAGGRTPSPALREQRQERQAWLASACVDALPRCIPVAASSLAAWYAGDDDVYMGARWAAELAIKARVFAEAEAWAPHWRHPDDKGEEWRFEWHTAAWLRSHEKLAKRARELMNQRLVRGLRAVIPSPFE